MGGRSVTTTLKLEALAARERPVVSVVSDAHWFLPFLQAVLPAALGRGIDWNQRPSGETDILVETPLRSHDCAGDVHELCFRLLISGEPYSLATLTGYDLIVDTKDDEAARPSDTAFLYVPFYVTSFSERRCHRPEDLLAGAAAGESGRPRFAAFLYHQCMRHRELFFDVLNDYRPVDALGKCRHRVDGDGRCLPRTTNRSLYTDEQTYLDDAVARYRHLELASIIERLRVALSA